ncbi:hypothetical protein GCM10025776_05130 [Corallincola platygyrae]
MLLNGHSSLHQIKQTSDLPHIYIGWNEGQFGYYLESREHRIQALKQGRDTRGGALLLEPVIELFRLASAKE